MSNFTKVYPRLNGWDYSKDTHNNVPSPAQFFKKQNLNRLSKNLITSKLKINLVTAENRGDYLSYEKKLRKEANMVLHTHKNNSGLDEFLEHDEYCSVRLLDTSQLDINDPKIKLKLNVNGADNPLPRSLNPVEHDKNLKSLQANVHLSVVKDYDYVVAKKLELKKSTPEGAGFRSRDTKSSGKTTKNTLNKAETLTSLKLNEFFNQATNEFTNNYDDSSISNKTLSNESNLLWGTQNSTSSIHSNRNKKDTIAFRLPNHKARKFFRHKVRIVIALIKIVEFAFEKLKKSSEFIIMNNEDHITEIVQNTFISPTSDTDKIVFNKDFYKAKKETEVGKEMQFTLTIPPEARTAEQIKQVRIGLSKVDAFAEYPINMQEKIVKCAFYQKVPPKRVIIRQGQVADSFYFIISGQAMVTILDQDKKTSDSKNRILAVLREGTCFGELAFLYNSTRTATVTSLTNMELISIGRDDFFDIFMTNKGDEPEHIAFLRKCSFMNHWPLKVLLENPQNCLLHYYKRGQVIVKNSQDCDYIYVVKSGTCQVLKKLEDVKPKTAVGGRAEKDYEKIFYDVYKSKIDTGLKKEKTEKKTIPWSFTNVDDVDSGVNQPAKPVFLQLQLLKSGETFGLSLLKFNESDNDLPDPELSLISQGAEVLMINRDVFLKHANEQVKGNLRRNVQPYPQTEVLQKKLQSSADWQYFKDKALKNTYLNLKKQRKA